MEPTIFWLDGTITFTILSEFTLFFSPFGSDNDDWNDVIKECSSLAANWYHLSGYLGLSISLIDSIKGSHPDNPLRCWNEALKNWIKQNYNTQRFHLPSWRTLLEAVARVDRLLFKKLASTHQGASVLLTYNSCAHNTL